MKNVKLFVFDLDGTALGGETSYAKFTGDFSEFLDRLSKQDIAWCINTTWDINGQWELILNSKVKSRPAFLIGEMGHVIARGGKDGFSMDEDYNQKMERKVKECNKKIVYSLIKEIVNKFQPGKMYFYGHLFSFSTPEKGEKFRKYADKVKKIPGIKVYAAEGKLTVFPSFLGKGRALKYVEKIMGVSSGETVIAGDEAIDLPMMIPHLGKYLICPSNSSPVVKQRVLKNNGVVASHPFARGVIEGWKKTKTAILTL
jgi:HAD superfamily hydrolase (TIGR01484 family)